MNFPMPCTKGKLKKLFIVINDVYPSSQFVPRVRPGAISFDVKKFIQFCEVSNEILVCFDMLDRQWNINYNAKSSKGWQFKKDTEKRDMLIALRLLASYSKESSNWLNVLPPVNCV